MFSAIFVKRPKFALVISLFLIIAGLVCVFQLPVAEYPEISPPTVVVLAVYPGATAQEIADTVAAPIESEINGVEDLLYYSSTSDNAGNYTLTMTFKSDCDANMAYVNVNNAIKRAEHSLPAVVTNTGLFVYKRSNDILGVYVVSSDNPEHTPLFLSNYVSVHMRDAISRIPGVGYAVVFTDMTYSMRIKMDPLKMRALGVSAADIRTAVSIAQYVAVFLILLVTRNYYHYVIATVLGPFKHPQLVRRRFRQHLLPCRLAPFERLENQHLRIGLNRLPTLFFTI